MAEEVVALECRTITYVYTRDRDAPGCLRRACEVTRPLGLDVIRF
jgi:hypothetical protein